MASALVYEPRVYAALPHLGQAADSFEERNPVQIISDEISALFLEHQVWEDLSVCLLHRHFDLKDGEKLVEFGSVSSPWSNPNKELLGGEVVPRSWLFVNGEMRPYEFGYNESPEVCAEPRYKAMPDKPAFYEAFGQVLKKHGLEDLLGLQLNSDITEEGKVKFEKTFDRANVVFTIPIDTVNKPDAVIAQWLFKPDGATVGTVKKMWCISGCICHRSDS